ncbi:hypothetical protein [Streptomyces niveus]
MSGNNVTKDAKKAGKSAVVTAIDLADMPEEAVTRTKDFPKCLL